MTQSFENGDRRLPGVREEGVVEAADEEVDFHLELAPRALPARDTRYDPTNSRGEYPGPVGRSLSKDGDGLVPQRALAVSAWGRDSLAREQPSGDDALMPGGRCSTLAELPGAASEILRDARRAVLVTLDSRNRPHTVPVCYVVVNGEIVTPIDAKPKSTKRLARSRNVQSNSTATLLVDRWSEDWSRLGWIMARGTARFESVAPVAEQLVDRYPQYSEVSLGEEAIVIAPDDVAWWVWG
jgi:PPOX class probable F420-dependent enzyme